MYDFLKNFSNIFSAKITGAGKKLEWTEILEAVTFEYEGDEEEVAKPDDGVLEGNRTIQEVNSRNGY